MRETTFLVLPLLIVFVGRNSCAAETQTVHPSPTDARLVNPHMGFVYYGGNDHPDVADVYYPSVVWGDFEPEEGKFNWDGGGLGDFIRAARSRGKRVAFRIMPSFQGKEWATPKWVHDLGVKRFPVYLGDDTSGPPNLHEPEWWNPVYIEKYCNFVAAYGKQFDGQPWLDYVDIRCYGFWGEGHRFHAKVPWPKDAISKRDLNIRFIDAHLAAFRKTPLVVETACDENTPYPEGTAIDYALDKGCWMRRDGFGPFISDGEITLIKERWKSSALIAENGYGYFDFVRGKVSRYWVPGSEPITLEAMFDQMLDLHCNYIPLGWGDRDWHVLQWRPDLLRKVWMRMGYRFVITRATFPVSAQRGETVRLAHCWKNVAVGRLPVRYPLAVYLADVEGNCRRVLLDENFDETRWFDGEEHEFEHSFAIPEDLAPGDYFLAVALVDAAGGKPSIALGIEGEDSQRRYILGTLLIQ
ncbi:MAG TPA: DUF4832 domain-containing protein [Candidatus Brocadiia bacterium]|nr:DUF4832 domain-containing protein [Candidatus Brocadiia bacterium]